MGVRAIGKVKFLQGNEACALGAVLAGCRFFAGYPITPSSEIAETMAAFLPKVGGVFVQVEDELAAINTIIGASWAGMKAMTATSGPGFSLMQEGIGYAIMTETPVVIVDVQRVGPSTGQATKNAQGDVMQAIWGRHGDQALVVLSPSSAQEMLDMTVKAFNISEEYRCPVVLLADEFCGHVRERVEVPNPDDVEVVERKKPKSFGEAIFGYAKERGVAPMPSVGEGYNLLVTGSTHNEHGYRFTSDPQVHRRMVTGLYEKIMGNADKIAEYEAEHVDDAEALIVCYGSTSRMARVAVKEARRKGAKIGYFRLETLWPLPERDLEKHVNSVSKVLVPELNLGQLVREVERVASDDVEVLRLNKIGGGEVITPEEMLSALGV